MHGLMKKIALAVLGMLAMLVLLAANPVTCRNH